MIICQFCSVQYSVDSHRPSQDPCFKSALFETAHRSITHERLSVGITLTDEGENNDTSEEDNEEEL